MIDRRIGKIKIRRGTDTQRKSIVFPEGELLYTTDHKRIYVGDGSTGGGIVISNKNYVVGDLYNLPYNSLYGDIIHNITEGTSFIVGSAENGDLIPIKISGPNCCDKLKAQLDLLKTRVDEISVCVNKLQPRKEPPKPGSLEFVIQPSDASVNVGETATFTASAVGPGNISYQWYRSDTAAPIQGGIGTKFVISKVQVTDISNYYCVANSTSVGIKESNRATLTIGGNSILSDPDGDYILSDTDGGYIDWDFSNNVAPVITLQPKSISTTALTPASFTIDATGTQPLTYQWMVGGVNQVGGTDKTFIFPNPSLDINNITCKVSNIGGEVISNSVNLTVGVKPSISKQPLSQEVSTNSKTTLNVIAAGSAPLNYQWLYNGANISGATSDTYIINATIKSNEGSYSCIVTNSFGSITSDDAILKVVDTFTTDDIHITANTQNFNLKNTLINKGWDGKLPIKVNVYIDPNVMIGSNSTSLPSFIIDSLPNNSIVTLTNNGAIYGAGGNGGFGIVGLYGNTKNAQNGGTAINTSENITIINNGIIGGGGGGGGGGYWLAKNPSGGGGGAGKTNGKGTTNMGSNIDSADGTSTTGGAGGSNAGRGGDIGKNGSGGRDAGGSYSSQGGLAGYYIEGDSFVTWQGTGSKLGRVK